MPPMTMGMRLMHVVGSKVWEITDVYLSPKPLLQTMYPLKIVQNEEYSTIDSFNHDIQIHGFTP